MNNKPNKKCIIIGAGDFYESCINKGSDDLLVVADGGYNNYLLAKDFNINDIDYLVGDFDSLELDDNIKSKIKNIVKLNIIKDDTDILDAIKLGFSNGYNQFVIYGALGKRFEHSLANIYCLSYIKENGGNGIIIDRDTNIMVIKNEKVVFDKDYKRYFSMFSLDSTSKGVFIKNMKYELDDYEVKEYYSIGIDNEFIGKESYIEVKNGKLVLVFHNYKTGGRE